MLRLISTIIRGRERSDQESVTHEKIALAHEHNWVLISQFLHANSPVLARGVSAIQPGPFFLYIYIYIYIYIKIFLVCLAPLGVTIEEKTFLENGFETHYYIIPIWFVCEKTNVCLFVCLLFVCLFVGTEPENFYFASCWEGSKQLGSGHTRVDAQNRDVHTKDSGTTNVLVNPCLTPFSFFLSLVCKSHWTKRMVSTPLST